LPIFANGSASDPDHRQEEKDGAPILGGIHQRSVGENSAEIEELARFAVDEHNKKQNALLEFSRVLKAKEQAVAGIMHYLTVEAIEAGKKKIYEAKIWVKPWLDFKELQEFTHTGDSSPTITPADLGAKRGGHERGWRMVPPHDPTVKDAANHAVKTIQQRSNSLAAYELLEILHSKAEVIEDLVKFDLLLKLRRGSKEEKYKVEVHKNLEGNFHLNQMQEEM
ncbi:cysteine proteinase inhibitor 12-like, partial [Asparagus officinalis]|uniref:cysteine proteinase inhibitor 12-like n=1 Tax=Asparagus officinalis TaxID=4686 RepID=UPI00098DFEA6